jgi:hypothetical protein
MVTVAFDTDGTLKTLVDTPRYEVIEMFQMYQRFGCDMYIWSGSGAEYAARWAEKFGLVATVVVKGSFVPDIAVDDMDVTLGKVNIKV